MKKDIQLLIIPDVHGRDFWKKAVALQPDKPVVFLGDYLDPYDADGISGNQAINTFKEIISLKQSRPDSVHLLLGNHDMAFLDSRIACSRHMRAEEDTVRSLFMDALDCFDLAFDQVIAGKRFLFSHAGISKGWLSNHGNMFDGMPICADLFNLMFKSPEFCDYLVDALSDVSSYRGGQCRFGSMIWADAEEMMHPQMQLAGFVQIFGHSQQEVEPCCLKDKAYCLDCRKVFYIDSESNIREYDSDEIVGEGKYIFLDIDGVVTSSNSCFNFDTDCFDRLAKILDRTGAGIVVSSSWRAYNVKDTIRNLANPNDVVIAGNPFPFCDRIVGITPHWPMIDDDSVRGKEIDAYLGTHPCSSYVILDDIYDFLPEQDAHVVNVHDSTGISDEDVVKAKQILNML